MKTLNEKKARIELARAYRVFAHIGWTELIFNHITLAIDDRPGEYLLNPYGLTYAEVTPENLVLVNYDGEIIGESPYPANPAGFTIHGAVHRARGAGATCVMHTHTTAGMAVACLDAGLSWSNFYAAQLYGDVAYHEYEGITDVSDEMPRLIANLGERNALILRNHGLLACGPSIEDAFYTLWKLNRACEVQLATVSMGPARSIPREVLTRNANQIKTFDPSGIGAKRVYDALVREVARTYPEDEWLKI
jgi:ribulose-5-phosphate 4-epimerase/fuculose-1-phosphate aldolase